MATAFYAENTPTPQKKILALAMSENYMRRVTRKKRGGNKLPLKNRKETKNEQLYATENGFGSDPSKKLLGFKMN
jgi:hypothetical protein